MTIYVDLPGEAVSVWCPVEAVHVRDDIYKIVQVNEDPVDTRWAFDTGTLVRCKPWKTREGEEILVAFEEVADKTSTSS